MKGTFGYVWSMPSPNLWLIISASLQPITSGFFFIMCNYLQITQFHSWLVLAYYDGLGLILPRFSLVIVALHLSSRNSLKLVCKFIWITDNTRYNLFRLWDDTYAIRCGLPVSLWFFWTCVMTCFGIWLLINVILLKLSNHLFIKHYWSEKKIIV